MQKTFKIIQKYAEFIKTILFNILNWCLVEKLNLDVIHNKYYWTHVFLVLF
jgi:hypothetical protein